MMAAKKPQTKKHAKSATKRSTTQPKAANAATAELAESNLRLTILVAIFAGLSIVLAAMAFNTYL